MIIFLFILVIGSFILRFDTIKMSEIRLIAEFWLGRCLCGRKSIPWLCIVDTTVPTLAAKYITFFLHNVGSGNMSVLPINSGSYVTVLQFTVMPLVTACVV